MEGKKRDQFISQWRKYFGDADLPLAVFFSDEREPKSSSGANLGPCVISMLPVVRDGKTLCLSAEDSMCRGARRYLGLVPGVEMRNFEYFLSYGLPGKLEGERYKKSPDLVRESERFQPSFKAPRPFIVFKRWDKLSASDLPEIIVFLARIDTISGLFTLANFDEAEPNAVICPFGSGCSSIVYYPYMELRSRRPRCILGMFDISARPCIGECSLSFAIPFPKFERMAKNMSESFLTTKSWKALSRIGRASEK